MNKYILQLIERNLDNPLQVGKTESIEGNTLIEITHKFYLRMIEKQRQMIEELELDIRILENDAKETNDDVPF